MKRNLLIIGAVALFVFAFAGCSLFGPDTIVGSWQQVSASGVPSVLTTIDFTKDTYTYAILGGTTNTGTWKKSGDSYTLTGVFLGFLSTTTTITPTFTNSDNTMTFAGSAGDEVYNRK